MAAHNRKFEFILKGKFRKTPVRGGPKKVKKSKKDLESLQEFLEKNPQWLELIELMRQMPQMPVFPSMPQMPQVPIMAPPLQSPYNPWVTQDPNWPGSITVPNIIYNGDETLQVDVNGTLNVGNLPGNLDFIDSVGQGSITVQGDSVSAHGESISGAVLPGDQVIGTSLYGHGTLNGNVGEVNLSNVSVTGNLHASAMGSEMCGLAYTLTR